MQGSKAGGVQIFVDFPDQLHRRGQRPPWSPKATNAGSSGQGIDDGPFPEINGPRRILPSDVVARREMIWAVARRGKARSKGRHDSGSFKPCGRIAQSRFAGGTATWPRRDRAGSRHRRLRHGTMPSCSVLGGMTRTSAGRMSKDQWVTRSSALSSIPTTSLSSVGTRWVRTPRENEPILSEKSPMPTCAMSRETCRGRVASPRHANPGSHGEGPRNCPSYWY